eukprot:1139902-Pelagomonas_calceolata.AAC.2
MLREWIREKQIKNWQRTKHLNIRKPIRLPGYLHLDLPQHVTQIVSRCRLRAHTLNGNCVLEGWNFSCVQSMLMQTNSRRGPCPSHA